VSIRKNKQKNTKRRQPQHHKLISKQPSVHNEMKKNWLWELEEKKHWEGRSYSLSPKLCFRHRHLEREKYVFSFLRDKIKGKHLLEIGCGTSYRIRDLLNPLQHNYFYVGTDVASKPMRIAKKFMVGDFVQCVGRKMPFKASVFDVVLCLGVIHHLPGGDENIPLLSNLLRKYGYFIAAETMLKKVPFTTLSRAFKTKIEKQSSPHENRLDKERFIKNVQKIGELTGFKGDIIWNTIPSRPLDIKELVGDYTKAKHVLGWEPRYTLEAGLRKTINFWRAQRRSSQSEGGFA